MVAIYPGRMQGYNKGEAVSYARFGQGRGNIWIDELNCTGNESNVQECTHPGLGVHDCSHYEDASVICTGENQALGIWTQCKKQKAEQILYVGALYAR